MRSAQPYIYMKDCKTNMKWYADVLKGTIQNVQFSDEDKKPCKEENKYILHGELVVGESLIHFCDQFDTKQEGNQIQIVLKFEDEKEIQSIYEQLIKEGNIVMPLQETFWHSIHGHVIDKNGIPWILDYQRI